MRYKIKAKFFWTWLTALAVLLSALAPTISHATRARQGDSLEFSSICTNSGLKWVDAKTGEILEAAPASTIVPGHDGFCDACFTHTPALLPTSQIDALITKPTETALPFLFLHAPRTLFAWSQSNPRAPPAA